ncbi:MAG: hypothetical protein IJQ49_02330 [Prevotella sp.]|nr:hypothetical protein [Prevotella sp.]
MKLQKYIAILAIFTSLTAVRAQEHTRFLDLPLDLTPEEIVEALEDKGLQQEDRYELSGRIAGLDVWMYVNVGKDSTKINHLLLTSQQQQGNTQRDDYVALRKWMQKHYGAPTWESTVRSHSFARWYIGFDRDIVMIATASAGVEIWFYENHQRRNIDYYAILKYCERNPAPGLPVMFARDNVTWKSTGDTSTVKKKAAKRNVRKATKKKAKATKKRRSKTAKSKKQRRKR